MWYIQSKSNINSDKEIFRSHNPLSCCESYARHILCTTNLFDLYKWSAFSLRMSMVVPACMRAMCVWKFFRNFVRFPHSICVQYTMYTRNQWEHRFDEHCETRSKCSVCTESIYPNFVRVFVSIGCDSTIWQTVGYANSLRWCIVD